MIPLAPPLHYIDNTGEGQGAAMLRAKGEASRRISVRRLRDVSHAAQGYQSARLRDIPHRARTELPPYYASRGAPLGGHERGYTRSYAAQPKAEATSYPALLVAMLSLEGRVRAQDEAYALPRAIRIIVVPLFMNPTTANWLE